MSSSLGTIRPGRVYQHSINSAKGRSDLVGHSELDLAGPVAAGPVHQGVHLCTGKAGQQDGLPVQRAMPRQ